MVYEHRSDCWYKDVCQIDICDNCIRYLEMSHLMESSGIPKVKQLPVSLIPEDCDYQKFVILSSIKSTIAELVANGNFNLYICSNNPGNGKTSWAIKIMLKYFDEVWAGNGFRTRGVFVHVPTFLMQLKNFQNPLPEEYKEDILNADLVIWDDIALANISIFDYSNLMMYLDNRILNERSNIFTSNKTTRKELEEVVGNRLASRVWEMSQIIEFKGKDRRNG